MDYLLYHNGNFIRRGQDVREMAKGYGFKQDAAGIEKARLCCVDFDVMIASAPQEYVDQRDALLARKFEEMYGHEHITLHERIDQNVFQVFGVKADTVKEVYGLFPSPKVEVFVPYALAVRHLLVKKRVDTGRRLVFIDDLGPEKLITVFEGLKFSRTRTISTAMEKDILPDIKRSFIDFGKKLGDFASQGVSENFTLVTNSRPMMEDIRQLEPGLAVEFLDCPFPSQEGLEYIDPPIKYRLREEIIGELNARQGRLKLMYLTASIGVFLAGAFFAGFSQMASAASLRHLDEQKVRNAKLTGVLRTMDPQIYRDYLKQSKYLNYSGVFFEIAELLPSTYDISSFKFSREAGHWVFSTYISAQDDQFYDEIPRTKVLHDCQIKDFFIQNRPGKFLKVVL